MEGRPRAGSHSAPHAHSRRGGVVSYSRRARGCVYGCGAKRGGPAGGTVADRPSWTCLSREQYPIDTAGPQRSRVRSGGVAHCGPHACTGSRYRSPNRANRIRRNVAEKRPAAVCCGACGTSKSGARSETLRCHSVETEQFLLEGFSSPSDLVLGSQSFDCPASTMFWFRRGAELP